jgi:hypothetical protein
MVHQWPTAFCAERDQDPCIKNGNPPPPRIFTIHGLWPSNFSHTPPRCDGALFNETLVHIYIFFNLYIYILRILFVFFFDQFA